MRRFFLLTILVCLCAVPAMAADKNRINLLRLPAVKVDRSSSTDQDANLAHLIDENPSTVLAAVANTNSPFEVVFGFGAVVTPERLSVRLPTQAPEGGATARVEIRVSQDSPDAGFQFVRADPLKASGDAQEFSLPPTTAKWIMIRFTPSPKAKQVAVADVAILGREGPPASQYAFKETPAKALDVIARLKKLSKLGVEITADEAALFADVQNGKFQKWSFAEAALLASGIHDKAKRQSYLKRLDWMTESAKQATAGAKAPLIKGDMLLRWLHKGPMAKGYKAPQTDLPVILETGTYNCVSSALLFNVIGRRLGLDVKAIEVPDHAFAILYADGKHADVETTTALGFNPARDKSAQQQFEQQTGFRYIADNHRDQRREVGEAGLVAIVYYNHGVHHSKAKRHHEALLAYFRAMSLDPEFASAVKNALAELASWGVELAKEGKFEDALLVCSAGLELAPKDYTLLHNRKVVWSVWADSRMRAGHEEDALAILRKAADEVPAEAEYFRSLQAGLYIRVGEELVKAKDWERAMAAIEPGLTKVDAPAQKDLKQWQTGVRQRWARSELDEKHYEQALGILAAGLVKDPSDRNLSDNLAYALQQWVRDTYKTENEERARNLLVDQIKRFPDAQNLRDVAVAHIGRVLKELRDAGKHEEALALLERHKSLLQEVMPEKAEKETKELAHAVYDGWSSKLRIAKEWQSAAAVYEKALTQYPKDYHLTNNLVYVVQEWAKDALDRGGEEAARTVLTEQVKRFDGVQGIRDAAKTHVQRLSRKLRDEGKFDEALAAVSRNSTLLPDAKEVRNQCNGIYDAWADSFLKKTPKDWEGALKVYADALVRHPKEGHLENNAAVTWDKWARTHFGPKDWKAAIQIYEKGLAQFPNNFTLKNNLDYCKKQMMK